MQNLTKKIVFFDGDGTLWYPRETKRTVKPFWIYLDDTTKDSYLEHLCLTPGAVETLRELHDNGIYTVILSTHPHEPAEAARILGEKVAYFNLGSFFDEVYATAEYPEAKGEKILEILERLRLAKDDALMVGDSYRWDYRSATDQGIDAVLLDSGYHQENREHEPVSSCIAELGGLMRHL